MSSWGKPRPGTAPAGVPAGHGTPRARAAIPGGQLSPQKRGGLETNFHSRFGSGRILDQDPGTPVVVARASKKSGFELFSDPTNPKGRMQAKAMTRHEHFCEDSSRAGGRTSNPSIIPCDASRRAVSADGERQVAIPYRYSTDVAWRPGKRNPDVVGGGFAHTAASPRHSHGVAEVLGAEALMAPTFMDSQRKPSVLVNYLNDMKKTRASLKHTSGAPSEALLKMNDGRSILPAHRQTIRDSPITPLAPEVQKFPGGPPTVENYGSYGETRGSFLAGPRPLVAPTAAGAQDRSRSCDPRMDSQATMRSSSQGSRHHPHDQSEGTNTYGFARKSLVNGSWTQSQSLNMLCHTEIPASPRRPEQKERKANARFEEMVKHMSEKNPEQKSHFEHLKSRGSVGQGIFVQNDD